MNSMRSLRNVDLCKRCIGLRLLTCLVCLTCLACCGGEPKGAGECATAAWPVACEVEPSPDVIGALRLMFHPRVWLKWDSGIKRAIEELRGGQQGIARVATRDAVQECKSADVVLVADMHADDLCRVVFARLMGLLRPGRGDAVAVVFEALSSEQQAAIDGALRTNSADGLVDLVRSRWPYPVRMYERVFLKALAYRCHIIGAGPPLHGLKVPYMPDPSTPDHVRMPVRAPKPAQVKLNDLYSLSDSVAAEQIDAYLKGGRGVGHVRRRALVLYGGGHLSGFEGSIRADRKSVV